MPEVLATYDGEGQPRDTFVYGLQRLAGIGADGKATTYVYDGLSSVRQLADAEGAVFDRYTYSPYGLPAASDRLNPSHKLNDGNTFGFGGQDHDPVFGTIYRRARYYTPGLGRFTAPDPLVIAGLQLPGMSPYAYGEDNPLAYLDPSGLVGQKLNRALDFTYAAMTTGLSVVGAATSLVMLAATPVGWAGFAVLAVLTASHFIGAVHDVSAFSQGKYDEIGTGDPLYKWAGEVGGAPGEIVMAGTEMLAWAGAARAISPGAQSAAKPGVGSSPEPKTQAPPPNAGFSGEPTRVTLEPGTRVDRYGYESGRYVSPEGTPYEMRSLPPSNRQSPYNVYEVKQEMEVQAGTTAPWYDQPGGGIQYRFDRPISDLLKDGSLRRVRP